MFVTMIISLYTVRVVINTLGSEEYGLYGAIGGVVMTLSIVSSTISAASQRFFSIEIGKGDMLQLRKVFSTTIYIYICVIALLFVLAETIGAWFVINKMNFPADRLDAVMWVFHFSVASFLITLIGNPFTAIIISRERMNLYAYLSILDVLLKLLIVYILQVVDWDKLKLYSVLMFCSVAIIQAIYIIYSTCKYQETHLQLVFDRKLLSQIASYCGWTLFGSVALLCNTQGLNILFNVFIGPLANTAYSIGNQVRNMIQMFGSNFYAAVRPAMTKSYAQCDEVFTRRLFFLSSKVLYSLLFVIMLPLIIEVGYVIKIWLGDVGEYMISFTRLMLINSLVLIMSEPITTIVQAAGAVKKYHTCVDGFSLLTLPISYVLLRYNCDPEWVLLLSIIVFLIAHVIRLAILQEKSSITMVVYTRKLLIPIFVNCIISIIPPMIVYLTLSESFTRFILICFVSVMTTLLSCMIVVFSKQERRLFISLVREKLKR